MTIPTSPFHSVTAPPLAEALPMPCVEFNQQQRFRSIILPLVDTLNHLCEASFSLTGSVIGEPNLPTTCYACIRCETWSNRSMERARQMLQTLVAYTRLNQRLGLMTFDFRQCIVVRFPDGASTPYSYLKVVAPAVFDPALFYDYVQGLIEFLKLRRHFKSKPCTERTLTDTNLRSIENAWSQLLDRKYPAAERVSHIIRLLQRQADESVATPTAPKL